MMAGVVMLPVNTKKGATPDCDVIHVGIGAAEEFRMQDITWHILRTRLYGGNMINYVILGHRAMLLVGVNGEGVGLICTNWSGL